MRKLLFLLFVAQVSMAQTVSIEEKVKFLALGDSYTIGESVAISERWPVQLIQRLRTEKGFACDDPRIIATTGWRTDNLKNAITTANIQPNEYNLVSLLIGVNNQYQGKTVESYAPEFEELLETAIALAGGNKSHVFVLSIPDYGYTPFGKNKQAEISAELDQFNAVNKSIAERLSIKYFNITDISRRGLAEPDLVANDGLHPSGNMYTEWVDLILKDEAVSFVKGVVTEVKKKKEEASITINPNPFRDFLNILSNPFKSIDVSLINCNGALVMAKTSSASVRLDTHSLHAGLYFYKIRTDGGEIVSGKLIKE
jgi:lysophospholipase L1-like esterase